MKPPVALAASALASALALAACGTEPADPAMNDQQVNALSENEVTNPDRSATFEGAGDTTSSVGAGALTGAIDGGEAGDDGLPEGAARGGPEDAVNGSGSNPAAVAQ